MEKVLGCSNRKLKINPETKFSLILKISKVKKPQKLKVFGVCIWWAHTDSNCGPTDYESAALTD